MSGQYDFREGMLLEKVVYKDESFDIKSLNAILILSLLNLYSFPISYSFGPFPEPSRYK